MRVLVVEPGPHFSVQDVAAGWSRGFAKIGCDVKRLNLADRMLFYSQVQIDKGDGPEKALTEDEAIRMAVKSVEVACYELWPHLVVIVSAFFIPDPLLDLLRDRGHLVVLHLTESPYEDDRQLLRAPHADYVLVNDPTHLEAFREVGPADYQWQCYDPDVHYPGQGEQNCDFAFVGTGFPSRIKFFEAIDWTGITPVFAGQWRALAADSPLRPLLAHHPTLCMDNTETADVYRSAKVGANLYRKDAQRPELVDGWSLGPREVEMAACGLFFLREPRGEGDELFPMLPTFDGPQDFEKQLRWWLEHDDERRQAAEQARQAIAPRTFENAARRLLGQTNP